MKKHLLLAALCYLLAGVLTASAGDDHDLADQLPEKPKASKLIRQESLEMPGVTACHQCEWRPKPHTKAAAEQCGTEADGKPKPGIFECGFAQDCERVCNFVRCAD